LMNFFKKKKHNTKKKTRVSLEALDESKK